MQEHSSRLNMWLLQAEASLLCSIHHPNIVRFYGVSVDDSHARGANYYLVSDMKNTDLRYAWLALHLCVFLPQLTDRTCNNFSRVVPRFLACSKVVDSEAQPSHAEVMRMASEICSPLVRAPNSNLHLYLAHPNLLLT